MESEERKPRLQINIGGLVILIILALILFKVDLREKIDSPQFQKNISYITEKAKDFWMKYVTLPLKSKAGDLIIDLTEDGLKKLQGSLSENLLSTDISEKIKDLEESN